MSKQQITAEAVAQAEASLVDIKSTGSREEQVAAMQAVADLRSAFRAQEEAAGARTGLVTTAEEA